MHLAVDGLRAGAATKACATDPLQRYAVMSLGQVALVVGSCLPGAHHGVATADGMAGAMCGFGHPAEAPASTSLRWLIPRHSPGGERTSSGHRGRGRGMLSPTGILSKPLPRSMRADVALGTVDIPWNRRPM